MNQPSHPLPPSHNRTLASRARRLLRSYPLSALCVAAIWILCLMPVPETPLAQVKLMDKWVHFVMFGGLSTVVWAECGLRHATLPMRRMWLYALLAPLLMGALVEIAQATCTGGRRSGDIVDFLADAIGVGLGQLIGIPLALFLSKRNRDS